MRKEDINEKKGFDLALPKWTSLMEKEPVAKDLPYLLFADDLGNKPVIIWSKLSDVSREIAPSPSNKAHIRVRAGSYEACKDNVDVLRVLMAKIDDFFESGVNPISVQLPILRMPERE